MAEDMARCRRTCQRFLGRPYLSLWFLSVLPTCTRCLSHFFLTVNAFSVQSRCLSLVLHLGPLGVQLFLWADCRKVLSLSLFIGLTAGRLRLKQLATWSWIGFVSPCASLSTLHTKTSTRPKSLKIKEKKTKKHNNTHPKKKTTTRTGFI